MMDLLQAIFSNRQDLLWLVVVLFDLGLTVLLFRLFGKAGLYGVIVVNVMLCNLLGPKITVVFGFNTTMGAILYSGIYFATDLLSERYGRREANRAVMLGFAASMSMLALGMLSLLFEPTPDPQKNAFATQMHDATAALFNFTPRFVLGSLLAYLVSQTHDVWMFHLLKRWTKGRHLWLRNNVSTMSSQLIDNVIYGAVVWVGIFDVWTAVELGLAKYLFKVLIALLDTPFIYWARTWRMHEQDWVEGEHRQLAPESAET